MANPIPLPIVDLEALRRGDKTAWETLARNLENIQIYEARARDVLYDTTTTDSLGAQIQSLQGRPKDIYTFDIGTPSVAAEGERGIVPLLAVADSTLLEVVAHFQTAPTGSVVFVLTVGGSDRGVVNLTNTTTATLSSFSNAAVSKNQEIGLRFTAVPESAGEDLIVQVRCA